MPDRNTTAIVQLKVRMREPLRAQLEQAAKGTGHSMNAEMVERFEHSFDLEDRLGGPGMVDLMETIAIVMKSTGEHAGFFETGEVTNQGRWMRLPYAFDQAMAAAVAILEHHRPPGEIVEPKPRKFVVVGVGNTEVDPKESIERAQAMLANLGQLIAAGELKKREEDDE